MKWVMNGGVALCVLGSAACLQAQDADSDWRDPYDSGGPLIVEQAAYDVTYYDLALAVDPSDRTITGTLRMDARMVAPAEVVALDLDTLLAIESISLTDLESAAPLSFRRSGSRVFVELPFTKQPGEDLSMTVEYGGKPRVAPRPPWDGGFPWATTPSGEPWIATSNQMIGADVWWPNKDHVSDKPDSMGIRITVPGSAGRGHERPSGEGDRQRRRHPHLRLVRLDTDHQLQRRAQHRALRSARGGLPERHGRDLPGHLLGAAGERGGRPVLSCRRSSSTCAGSRRTLGPYPFRADKYGVAQTPHLGMEHQSIIAYGANFDNGAMTGGEDWGFDALHHHELSHEWWGNLVTNADWKDMWIHEGFGTYMQALWLEDTQGLERYHEYMASVRPRMGNAQPTAPRHSLSAQEVYGGDIYFKGAWVLHTLRYLLGDEAVREALRRMAYPTEEAAWTTDGSQVRFVSTADVITVFGDVSGQDLGWLFEAYLRQAELPDSPGGDRGRRRGPGHGAALAGAGWPSFPHAGAGAPGGPDGRRRHDGGLRNAAGAGGRRTGDRLRELDPEGHAGTGILQVGAPDLSGLSQPVVLTPSCRR